MKRTRKCPHTQQTTLGKRNTEYRESISFNVLNPPFNLQGNYCLWEDYVLVSKMRRTRRLDSCAATAASVHIHCSLYTLSWRCLSHRRLTDQGWYPTESKPYADSLIPALAEKRAGVCDWCFFPTRWHLRPLLCDFQVLFSSVLSWDVFTFDVSFLPVAFTALLKINNLCVRSAVGNLEPSHEKFTTSQSLGLAQSVPTAMLAISSTS